MKWNLIIENFMKKFVDIHPFQPIFRAAIQDTFIKDEHPECIRVIEPTGHNVELERFNHVVDDLLDISELEGGSDSALPVYESTADDGTMMHDNESEMIDNSLSLPKGYALHVVAVPFPK